MAKKKLAFLIFTLALGELAFSFWHPHHEIGAIEAIEGFTVFLAGVVLYATDVHKFVLSVSQTMYKSVELKSLNAFNYGIASFFKRLSEFMYENIELRGIDAFNYFVAGLYVSFAQRFRKIQTGVLSYNMLMVLIGVALLIVLLFLFERQ